AERLLELGRKLRDFSGVQDVTPPAGLHADLRPYQRQGVSWLQFLREYGMGGILADDMGLGKTVQTLAHLLLEKESGRADRPSLVVAPTSVIGNWQAEAAKFAPDLRVLTLHGKDRRAHFPRIPGYDLILTTYPLLPRDIDDLGAFEYHLVILDEAQNIKNARTAAAKAAGALNARHRLALTGTPLENHLGELWSQFNFLAPGLLHDEKTFRELYRTPIEKRGEAGRRQALAARVRPFILRREKRDVARELPPKTEIPVRVTLDGDQRDLYETVRVTTETRVREELRARGLSRSTIAILDALLKLRQAVTDPRLVKLDAARSVEGNAKFEWLSTHLPQMVEEGRRVLIFSGFATLLGHLEDWLREQRIPYSMITGSTQDRQSQIDAFQSGRTHVFLITLKAGGVGLNLTAADTVIHYDPWWNPAAEEQATDRAYRIGQDKPVFVYKLIAAGSVEERILDLQARKASLARGILDGGLSDATQLTSADLDRLFAPLEDEPEGEMALTP
ncbi:DEAD/DEAH box helicase, partial [Deinococcus sp. 14RED07]